MTEPPRAPRAAKTGCLSGVAIACAKFCGGSGGQKPVAALGPPDQESDQQGEEQQPLVEAAAATADVDDDDFPNDSSLGDVVVCLPPETPLHAKKMQNAMFLRTSLDHKPPLTGAVVVPRSQAVDQVPAAIEAVSEAVEVSPRAGDRKHVSRDEDEAEVRECTPQDVSKALPVPRPCAPFFRGTWPGTRNNFYGEVGFSFVTQVDCIVTHLGRHVDGGALLQATTVTLWSVEPQAIIAEVEVGPRSTVEGSYAFAPIRACLRAGHQYRLTQLCTSKMSDMWCDGTPFPEQLEHLSLGKYAKLDSGVFGRPEGFPHSKDGPLRRAGMLNFKVEVMSLELFPVNKEELATRIGRIIVEECGRRPPKSAQGTDADHILAALLALFVDEMSACRGATVLVAVVHAEDLERHVRVEVMPEWRKLHELLTGAATGSPYSVFDKEFQKGLIDFAMAFRGRTDELGTPMEGVFLVCNRTGTILGAATRLFYGGTLLNAGEFLSVVQRGVAFARTGDGHVSALPASLVARFGQILRLDPQAKEKREAIERRLASLASSAASRTGRSSSHPGFISRTQAEQAAMISQGGGSQNPPPPGRSINIMSKVDRAGVRQKGDGDESGRPASDRVGQSLAAARGHGSRDSDDLVSGSQEVKLEEADRGGVHLSCAPRQLLSGQYMLSWQTWANNLFQQGR